MVVVLPGVGGEINSDGSMGLSTPGIILTNSLIFIRKPTNEPAHLCRINQQTPPLIESSYFLWALLSGLGEGDG